MKIILNVAVLVFCLAAFSCKENKPSQTEPETPITFTVGPAPEWTALLKREHGWFGGDGIFAIPFSGVDQGTSDSIMFLFSDTMVGDIEKGTLKPGYAMVNNSTMMLQGKEPAASAAHFLINKGADQKPASLFVPSSPETQKGDYYWLGDGFVNNDMGGSLCIFAYRIRNTNDNSAFPFREVGNNLIVIPKGTPYPFKEQKQYDLPFSTSKDSLSTSFGVGILANTEAAGVPDADGFVYVYGVKGRAKELVAARIKPAQLTEFASWEFYNGTAWTSKPEEAQPLADSVSNELSVTPLGNGKYALIYQYAGLTSKIFMQIGTSPVGPFGPRQLVWNTSTDITEQGLFTYNAKAHPAISKPGELLVSYNVNCFDFAKRIKTLPDLYRPRFVRIVFNTPEAGK
ncbi:MAG TPA: DUF4185 domain-containing protein [Chryseolinea sp.]